MKKKQKPLNILVVRTSALGDVAMTIPAIYSVAMTYPMHTFHVLTTALCAQLFVASPENVIVHPMKSKSLRVMLSYARSLKIDRVADLHNVIRSWVVDAYGWLCGKRVAMLNKRRWERGAVTKEHYATTTSFSERYYQVFANLELPCRIFFDKIPINALPPMPADIPTKHGKWIGIAPFARYKNKIYPLEKMLEVIRTLARHTDVDVFLFGSKKEAELLKNWCGENPRQHCVAGFFPLGQELSLISRLDVMLTMDSSNMHIASLVGTRVVSIWGGTTPACGFLGWRQDVADCILAGCTCQPCTIAGSDRCRHNDFHCLTSISPDTIVDKITIT